MNKSLIGVLGVALLINIYATNALSEPPPPSPSNELSILLMHATFLILGPDKNHPDKTAFGTVFVMGVPHPDNPKLSDAVMITAAHVLDNIGTDEATLWVRRKNGDGSYTAYPHKISIRDENRPRYVKNPTADVAAMYIELPADVPITGLPPNFLADDKKLGDIEMHPGDEVFSLGFPLAAHGPGGFPILRAGHIASYPLTPMQRVKQIDLDLLSFPGISGGPVYYKYTNRLFNGTTHFGEVDQGILGLVSQSTGSPVPEYKGESLDFAIIVPAAFIRDTIDLLPPKP